MELIRRLLSSTLTAALLLAARPGAIAAAAGQQAPTAPNKTTAAAAAKAEAWKTPRTPWGDPDLRGVFSNGDEYTTPLERPDRFAGRRLEDIKGQELADVRRAQLAQVIDALPGGRVRGPDGWWVQNLNQGKGGQAWMVVDPPDGKIPPLTPEARGSRSGPGRSSFLGGPFAGPEDLGLLDRCISRSVPGSMIPVMYGNNYEFVQVPGYVVITYEIIHEARIIPLDGRPHVGQKIRQHMGDAARPLRGRYAGRRDDQFHRARPPTAAPTPRPCASSNASRAWHGTPSSGRRRSTTRRPGRGRGRWACRSPRTLKAVMAFECHEGNYGMRNILSGARADDKARDK